MFAEELHWTLEASDLAAFYSADPTGFFIGELNGQPINHVIVKSASEVDFEKLLEYDTLILLALVDHDAPSCRNGLHCQVE